GIGKGDTVAFLCPNTPPLYEAHFGVPMCGAVLNAINSRLDAEAIAFILQHGEAKALFVDREFAEVAEKALRLLGRQLLVVAIDDPVYRDGHLVSELEYEQFLAEGDASYAWQPPQNEWDAITLNYTSGTTGDPKGVVRGPGICRSGGKSPAFAGTPVTGGGHRRPRLSGRSSGFRAGIRAVPGRRRRQLCLAAAPERMGCHHAELHLRHHRRSQGRCSWTGNLPKWRKKPCVCWDASYWWWPSTTPSIGTVIWFPSWNTSSSWPKATPAMPGSRPRTNGMPSR